MPSPRPAEIRKCEGKSPLWIFILLFELFFAGEFVFGESYGEDACA
jgi:hypothetical protein